MKNELLFIWFTLYIGWLEELELPFKIISMAIGSVVGIYTIIKLHKDIFGDKKSK